MASANDSVTKTLRARELGVSRGSLYYKRKLPERDWKLKCEIETVLREHPGYGSPRIATALKRNHKPIERVMQLFGIKAYRRRGRKWRKSKPILVEYPNLLLSTMPLFRGHISTADFTELWWRGKKVYLATVIDLYTREVVGVAMSRNKGVQLTAAALWNALLANPRPVIFHSDNGSEYRARAFVGVLASVGTTISRSAPGCPWENGYQESFYGKFKVDLGDPERFASFGELLAGVYATIWAYNTTRIHSALKMPPREFAREEEKRQNGVYKVGV
jgi:transposase InsO family protein